MALYLKDLFVYPIERYIPPVAKVDDVAEATIETELREYVVTAPIERALADFLEVYAESRTVPTDKIGVWISGFFGSGKSHFAKVLSYLLTNPTVGGRTARELFLERLAGSPRRAELEGLLHRVGLLDSRVIMFQIKAEQDQTQRDESISEIMYRRYLASRGLSTDPAVAGLELSLIERGLYDAFQAEVEKRVSRPWTEERDDYLFIRSTVAEALQAVAPEAYRSREEVLAALEMVDRSQRLTVSDLARRLVDYVDEGFIRGKLGRTVSMDMVYDQIAVDLQPQDRREIEGLPQQLPGYQTLDQRVLKALYLLQEVPWIAATADTLAHALLRDVLTENLNALKEAVQASLERLRSARYVVPKEEGVWEFLTGTKKSFEEEVAGVTVRQTDLRREARKTLAEALRPVGKLNYKDGLRTFDVIVRGDGEDLQSGQDIKLEVYSPLYVELEDSFSIEDLEQIESFAHVDTVYWVAAESPELTNHLTRSIKLGEVLGKWQARTSKTDEEREIIREKATELSTLKGKIETALRTALYNGTIVWNGRAEELDGRTTTLNPIFNRYVSQVVPHVYPKFDLAAVKPNEDEIKAVLTVAPYALPTVGAALDLFGADGHLNQHSAVVDEVRRELERRSNRGGDLSGKALEEHFTGGNYGWHPVIIRLVLAAMFRAGMVSVKAENVHYTDYTAPAAQVLLTQVRPFRRAVFFYEEAEAVAPDELRRTQDELKLIFDAPRREETANTLAEQIKEEMERWNRRAERVALQLRPAGYPIPEVLQGSQDLHFRVTRFVNPGKVVKVFLENLEAVRAWHAEVQILYEFIRDKKLPIFERARKLLEEIRRAEGVPGAEPLAEEDAQGWREALRTLVADGRAAYEWDRFMVAHSPLQERYRQVYQAIHQQRDDVVAQATREVGVFGMSPETLLAYQCQGLKWAEDGLRCERCSAPLKELYLQTVGEGDPREDSRPASRSGYHPAGGLNRPERAPGG